MEKKKTRDTIAVNVDVNTNSVDQALEKVRELHEKITEVKTLADEGTAVISKIKLEVELYEENNQDDTLKTDNIANCSTKRLVDELGIREGVEKIIAEPYENTTISVEGPAVILKIID